MEKRYKLFLESFHMLCERDSDVKSYDISMSLINTIIQKSKNNPSSIIKVVSLVTSDETEYNGILINCDDVLPNSEYFTNTKIFFYPKEIRDGSARASYIPSKNWIIIHSWMSSDEITNTTKIIEELGDKYVQGIIVHELSHLINDRISKGAVHKRKSSPNTTERRGGGDLDKYKKYQNDSDEITAHFRQAIVALIGNDTPDDLFEHKYDTFEPFLKDILNKFGHTYRLLNDENKKRIKSRAYTVWDTMRGRTITPINPKIKDIDTAFETAVKSLKKDDIALEVEWGIHRNIKEAYQYYIWRSMKELYRNIPTVSRNRLNRKIDELINNL